MATRARNQTSLTLIPCGWLATFPLTAVPLADGCIVGETIATSVAPSGRSLLQGDDAYKVKRSGAYAIGDPRPTPQVLPWGEAEALTFARSAQMLKIDGGGQFKIQEYATYQWFSQALRQGSVVDASCRWCI